MTPVGTDGSLRVNGYPARISQQPIRVLIVDDHAVFRQGLQLSLENMPDLEVVGDREDGASAVDACAELAPDVVLMDIRMPGMSGIDAARLISERHPAVRVVMLTGSQSEDDLFASIRAGASGYLLKEASTEEVADAVRAVANGQAFVSPTMTTKLLARFNALALRAEGGDGERRLTRRELEILALVTEGLSNKQIAAQLVISQNTVKNHVRNILEKLRLRSRAEAAAFAVRAKLVDNLA
jgi:DNA-binding NarL/FixJ family response regulator